MSVDSTIRLAIKDVETLAVNTGSAVAARRVVTHDQFDETHALTSATTPPVTKCAHFVQALDGGGERVDLAALVGANGATVNGTDLKVQALHVKNLGANTLTLTVDATNPYLLAGAGWSIILAQNQEFMFYGNDATPDIASDAKEIVLTGTGAQTSEWSVVMG